MVIDHLALQLGEPAMPLRLTVGRLAMPMFFLLAGHLARAPRRRHLWIGLLGVALGACTFVESPNVLTWWALGVCVLAAMRWAGIPAWLLVAVGLGLLANGYVVQLGSSYDYRALWALMALGSMLPAAAFTWAGFAPSWVHFLGRHPIAVYAGHVLALELLDQVLSAVT
jgi:hypothetical protein